MTNRIKVIIISGPTGVGKTKFSIELAKKYNGEIISCDSMQIYKNMDIGTAKVTNKEMQGIPHHLIDIIEPTAMFSVSDFQEKALEAIHDIDKRGKVPILVGGTGLYVDSIVYNMDFNETISNPKRRSELEELLNTKGRDALIQILISLDSMSVEKVDINNMRRVIRAIEILENVGNQKAFKSDLILRENIDSKIFILKRDREILYELINKRVDKMIADGLVKEVKALKADGLSKNHQSMKAIGYRQIDAYLEGEISLENAIELIKRDSRRYAKRQLTWFKKYKNAIVIDVESKKSEEILEIMYKSI